MAIYVYDFYIQFRCLQMLCVFNDENKGFYFSYIIKLIDWVK